MKVVNMKENLKSKVENSKGSRTNNRKNFLLWYISIYWKFERIWFFLYFLSSVSPYLNEKKREIIFSRLKVNKYCAKWKLKLFKSSEINKKEFEITCLSQCKKVNWCSLAIQRNKNIESISIRHCPVLRDNRRF